MNRRGFLSSLLAGVVAPAFLPGAGRKWVTEKGSALLTPTRAIINPEWLSAPYEVSFYLHASQFEGFLVPKDMDVPPPSHPEARLIQDPYGPRFASIEDYHNGKAIPPFKLV